MERTRDNLLRVQDVLRELERQMASLQRQARRAEEYHRIKGELRELDLRVMASRRRGWALEVSDVTAELAAPARGGGTPPGGAERHARGRRRRASLPPRARGAAARGRESSSPSERIAATEAAARITALAARREELEERAAQLEREGGGLRERLAAVQTELANARGRARRPGRRGGRRRE